MEKLIFSHHRSHLMRVDTVPTSLIKKVCLFFQVLRPAFVLGLLMLNVSVLVGSISSAGDWAQVLGNQRSGQAAEGESLPDALPTAGPKTVWSKDVGAGYAGPAVVGKQLFLFHRLGEHELVTCFSAADGSVVWETKLPADYRGGIDPDIGPRCVPTVDGDDVIVYGAAGQLSCLSRLDGKTRWSVALRKQFKAEDGYFGAGSTPLVLADRVLVNVGSRTAGIVAVERKSGTVLWKATAHDASYSSPILVSYQGGPLAVFLTRLQLVGIRPEDGKVEFEIPFGMRGPTVNAATPVPMSKNRLLLTASYGIGTLVADLNSQPPQVLLRDDSLLASQYVTPLVIGKYLYGNDGREDAGNGAMCCLDIESRKVLWKDEDFGVAHLIGVGEKILAIGNRGEVSLLRANPAKLEKLASFTLPPATYRALPAYADGVLWLRSNEGAGGGKLSGILLKN
jgi:outer membrane protein assembly factor BamB